MILIDFLIFDLRCSVVLIIISRDWPNYMNTMFAHLSERMNVKNDKI